MSVRLQRPESFSRSLRANEVSVVFEVRDAHCGVLVGDWARRENSGHSTGQRTRQPRAEFCPGTWASRASTRAFVAAASVHKAHVQILDDTPALGRLLSTSPLAQRREWAAVCSARQQPWAAWRRPMGGRRPRLSATRRVRLRKLSVSSRWRTGEARLRRHSRQSTSSVRHATDFSLRP